MTRLEWLAIGIMVLGILLPSMLEWVKREKDAE